MDNKHREYLIQHVCAILASVLTWQGKVDVGCNPTGTQVQSLLKLSGGKLLCFEYVPQSLHDRNSVSDTVLRGGNLKE
jgi:hypothetical protein